MRKRPRSCRGAGFRTILAVAQFVSLGHTKGGSKIILAISLQHLGTTLGLRRRWSKLTILDIEFGILDSRMFYLLILYHSWSLVGLTQLSHIPTKAKRWQAKIQPLTSESASYRGPTPVICFSLTAPINHNSVLTNRVTVYYETS
jgi:hypothetical protein